MLTKPRKVSRIRDTPTNVQTCKPYTAMVLTNGLVKAGIPREQIHLRNNWYYVSGFIDFRPQGGGVVYFCTFDFRDRTLGCYVRKAKDLKDYTGGRNRLGVIKDMRQMVLDCRDDWEAGY